MTTVHIGIEAKIFCEEHERMYENLALNRQAVVFQMMDACMSQLPKDVDEDDQDAIAAAVKGLFGAGKPICCMITEDDHERIIADTPQGTGDYDEDERVAMSLSTARRYNIGDES